MWDVTWSPTAYIFALRFPSFMRKHQLSWTTTTIIYIQYKHLTILILAYLMVFILNIYWFIIPFVIALLYVPDPSPVPVLLHSCVHILRFTLVTIVGNRQLCGTGRKHLWDTWIDINKLSKYLPLSTFVDSIVIDSSPYGKHGMTPSKIFGITASWKANSHGFKLLHLS